MKKGEKWQVPEALKQKWASIDEAAEEMKVSRDTIEKWKNEGTLQSQIHYGNRVLISRASIKAMLAPFL